MRCPMFMVHLLQEPGKVDLATIDCIKEECPWWSRAHSHCAIVASQGAYDLLVKTLETIDRTLRARGER